MKARWFSVIKLEAHTSPSLSRLTIHSKVAKIAKIFPLSGFAKLVRKL
jgi:hypothetical protein